MKNVDVVIIIPAYNPDKKLLVFLGDLIKAGYNKIIIIWYKIEKEMKTLYCFT